MGSRAVYTALFGDYEPLNDEQAPTGEIDLLCFTDDPGLASERWQVVLVEPEFPLDPHRSQRRVKIVGDPRLDRYDETLYIDNTVSLAAEPSDLFDELLDGADAGVLAHEGTLTLEDAFAIVWRAGVDDPHRVLEQWSHYRTTTPAALAAPLLWGGMIARRRGPAVDRAMSLWYDQVLRYSRRDQLSLPYILLREGLPFVAARHDQRQSPWHVWRSDTERNYAMRAAAGAVSPLGSLADHVREQELLEQIAMLTAQRDAAVAEGERPRRRGWRR